MLVDTGTPLRLTAAPGAQATQKLRRWPHPMTVQHHVLQNHQGQEAQDEFQAPPPPTPNSHQKNRRLEKVSMFILTFLLPF